MSDELSNEVRVTSFNMPFFEMVVFILKWWMAAIVAGFMICMVAGAIMLVFGLSLPSIMRMIGGR